jgi:endonuclease-8
MTAGEHWIDLRGPTACEVFAPHERDAVLARLGPDPLRKGADPDQAWARISTTGAASASC